MSGSALPTLGSSTWNRGVIGSVVSGSEEYKGATLLSDYTFKKANPFFRSGEVRYLRLNSASQTIKDTITPEIVSLYKTGSYGSGSLVAPTDSFILRIPPTGNAIKLLFSTDGKEILSEITPYSLVAERTNNIEWYFSYPYEKKYSLVNDYYSNPPEKIIDFSEYLINIGTRYEKRKRTIGNDSISIYWCSYDNSTIPASLVIQNYTDINGYFDGSNFTAIPNADPDNFVATLDNRTLAQKLVFGINPTGLSSNVFYVNTTPGANPNDRYVLTTGSIIEGWKYGLYNGIPTNFSAVFRQNHYGQFRDMLEQRIYTKTYNNPEIGGPMDANGGISFISGSALPGESNDWVTASIYNNVDLNVTEAYRVNPYGSGIFDIEYRASQPWHDEDTRTKSFRTRR
jgi:hypothetical protein